MGSHGRYLDVKSDGLENNSLCGGVSATSSLDVGSPPQREDKGPEKMNCPTPTISISRTIQVTIDMRVTVPRPDLRVRFRKRGPGGVSFSPTLAGGSDVPESRAPSSLCPVHTDHPKIIKMRILIQEAWGGA